MKWIYPRKEAIKIEGSRLYLLQKEVWLEIIQPSKNVIIYNHYVKVLLGKKNITIHFSEPDLQELKIILKHFKPYVG